MASDSSPAAGKSEEDKAAKRAERKQRGAAKESAVDIQALEKRVHLAELQARELEAQLRHAEASAKWRSMKSEKRGEKRRKKGEKGGSE